MSRSRRLRAAALELCQTLRTVQGGVGSPRLWADALAQCAHAVVAATVDGDLGVALSADAVAADGAAVAALDPAEPLAVLREGGIGSILFERGVTAATVVAFAQAVAALPAAPPAGDDPIAALHRCDFPGIRLRTPAADEIPPLPGADPVDWRLLPSPEPPAELRRLAQTTYHRRLRTFAARLLVADIGDADDAFAPVDPLLEDLFANMLARGDAADAAWLIAQIAERRDGRGLAQRLRDRATAAFHVGWLAAQIAQAERLDGLVALAIELGEDAVQRLAEAVELMALPLPPALAMVLPGRC